MPVYGAANCTNTCLQAGEIEAAWFARHCMMRPPPGATPPQTPRTSPLQADLNTNSSSRGSIGRSLKAGASAAAAGAAPGLAVAVATPAAGAAVPPLTALRACWQPPDVFVLFLSRHCSAAEPPVGTPAQTF